MPRVMSNPSPPTPQRDTFVGRVRELAEFRNSMRYVLGKEPPPTGSPFYPHIFLPHGEGGMGKSALLRQFLRIAREEGLPDERIIVLDLDYHGFPTADALGWMLAERISKQHPGFDGRYRAARARRDELAERYRELERQWARWEALRGSDDRDIDELLDAHRATLRRTEIQRATFGDPHSPPYLLAQIDQATDELTALLAFRDERGHAPRSFDELLQRELGADAALFGAAGGLGQALADDLFELAERTPLLLALDTYERADEHDDWVRTTILANSSDRMLTIIAGRNRHDADYRRTFSGEFANLVRSYNLNDQALQPDEVRQYLALRLKQDDPPDELVTEVHTISRGIPLALDALGDQLAGGGDLTPYREMELKELDRRAVVYAVTERFLRYALNDRGDDPATRERKRRDRQRIRALALLLQPDAELACALWGVPMEQGQAVVEDLAERHSFIFAGYGPYEMHDLVYEFVREYMRAERRNSFDWPALAAGLRRVLTIVERRAEQIERNIGEWYKRYEHANWRTAILDMLNVLLWLGEEGDTRRLLLNRWIEAKGLNIAFSSRRLNLVRKLVPETADWRSMMEVLEQPAYKQLDVFAHLLEPQAQAALCYLCAMDLMPKIVEDEDDLKQLNNSIALFEQGQALDRTWIQLLTSLAKAFSDRGHYQRDKQANFAEALTNFEQSLRLRPDDPHTLHSRGWVKGRLGDWAGALADYDQSLILRPENPTTLRSRGWAKSRLGDWAGALADYDHSLALRPAHSITLYYRGTAKRWLNDLEGALADFEHSLLLRPAEAKTIEWRGYVKGLQGNLEEALADMAEAIHLNPDDSSPIYSTACIYTVLGHIEVALDWLVRAIEINTKWRERATTDPDFDSIRADPRFIALVGDPEPRTENDNRKL